MAGQLLHALHRTDSRCPLIIIENAHLNHRRILDDLQRAISLIPDGQFFADRQTRSKKSNVIFKKQGIELVSTGRLMEHELKASILEGQNIDQPDLLLTARVLKRIALLCRGDRRKLALAGETISLLQQAEQTSVFTAKHWRMIYRVLGDNRPPENAACRGDEWNHYRTYLWLATAVLFHRSVPPFLRGWYP